MRPGYYADGGNLVLQVSRAQTKSWLFRYTLGGRAREMGLGPLHAVSLASAREKAERYRGLLVDQIDPITTRDAERAARALAAARAMSFSQCAAAYIQSHRAKWRNAKHAAQWNNTLETYAYPVVGGLNVTDVDTAGVLKILEPIWTQKHETATRLRQRIEAVLNWASARGYRSGENPARWRGHLQNLLPALSKSTLVQHHAALPYDQMGEFLQTLRAQAGVAARALEFAILTAARTGEVIGATWEELDLERKVWTVLAKRMKAGREHRVPLSELALAALDQMKEISRGAGAPVFPGQLAGKPLSNMAMLELLKRMGREDLTTHGFRSSFRDWCSERTSYPREVCEMALAHAISDRTESAYRRGDLFEKRRRLMAEWAKHCETPRQPRVVPIRKGAQ
jgi:integrase